MIEALNEPKDASRDPMLSNKSAIFIKQRLLTYTPFSAKNVVAYPQPPPRPHSRSDCGVISRDRDLLLSPLQTAVCQHI